jgi:hypothetical protein
MPIAKAAEKQGSAKLVEAKSWTLALNGVW